MLGEYEKWVPVSHQRITRLQTNATFFEAELHGSFNETIAFAFVLDNEPIQVYCGFSKTKKLKIKFSNKKLSC